MKLNERTTQELMIGMKVYEASSKMKIMLLEELLQRYVKERNFNFYEFMISCMYGGYKLGRGTMGVRRNMQKALKLMDMVVRAEAQTKDSIPQNHVKWLFSFVKETLMEIHSLIKSQKWSGDFNRLQEQLEFFKTIMTKAKEHSDITTVFDNVIHMVSQRNQLLLESGEQQPPTVEYGTLSLTAPLYKMSKKALDGIVAKLPFYQEDDYYKIVEYVISKYGERELRYLTSEGLQFRTFPVSFAIMNRPSEKINGCIIDLTVNLSSLSEEQLQQMIYYPLPVANIDELYVYYERYVTDLYQSGVVNEEEREYLLFEFISRNHHHSIKLAQRFIDYVAEFLPKVELHSHHSKTLSESLEYTYQYTLFTEMIIKWNNHDSYSKKATFCLKVTDGKVQGCWGNMTKRVKVGYDYKTVPKEPTIEREWMAVSYINQSFIKPIKPYLENEHITIPPHLLKCIKHYESAFYQVQIEKVNEELKKELERYENKPLVTMFNSLVQYRAEHQLLSEDELRALFETDTYVTPIDLRRIKEQELILVLERLLKTGILNLNRGEDFRRILFLFHYQGKKPSMVHTFLVESIEQAFPEQTSFAKALTEQDEGQSKESFEVKQQEAVFSFFWGLLESKGYKLKNAKFYF